MNILAFRVQTVSSDDDRSSFLDTTNKRLNGMTIGANKITIANFR